MSEVDKLASVTKKVETVKLVMQENVELALQNCVKLETIERDTGCTLSCPGMFKLNANELKKKMWRKKIKVLTFYYPQRFVIVFAHLKT